MEKKINIAIVHYNTPLLTECLVRSINKFTPNCQIYVFDNSDDFPFVYRQENITYFDNTKGQYINFDKFFQKYPTKTPRYWAANKCASARHCISIQKCIELIDDNFILLDSDVLLKKDITPVFDEGMMFVGEVGHAHNSYERVFPWFCFINVNKMKEHGIAYFNDQYILGLNTNEKCDWYDTGAYFYKQAKDFPHRKVRSADYVEHFTSASWNGAQTTLKRNEFLNKHANLYLDNSDEKLIVTMTSWRGRIKNLKTVLSTILANTKLPDEIIVNLSEAEFPGKEEDLLKEFVDFVHSHDLIKINWIPGKNTKQWKKIIPTLASHPKDAVICIDDDRKYPKDFIKTLYDFHLKNPNFPVTVDQKVTVCGMKQHCGHGTLDKLEYFGDMLDVFTDDIMQNPSSDTFFAYMCKRTGREILPTPYDVNRNIKLWNEIEPLHKSTTTYNPKTLKDMVILLDKKFGLSFQNGKKNEPKGVTSAQAIKRNYKTAVNIDEILQSHYVLKKKPSNEQSQTANKIKEVKTKNPVLRRHLISKRIKTFLKPSTF